MLPTQRTYGLLIAGGAVATLLANVADGSERFALALLTLLCFDGAVLLVMLWDGWRVRGRRASISRVPLQRLSIGRDNPVELVIEAKKGAELLIYDRYPAEFEGEEMPLRAVVAEGTRADLTYTVKPGQRGEYAWGDLEVRQRGPLKLAWGAVADFSSAASSGVPRFDWATAAFDSVGDAGNGDAEAEAAAGGRNGVCRAARIRCGGRSALY